MRLDTRWYVGTAALTLALTSSGCGTAQDGSDSEFDDPEIALQGDGDEKSLSVENGLSTFNGMSATNGLISINGLTTKNGLRTLNGIRTLNGLGTKNGLRTLNGYSIDCVGKTPGKTCTGEPDGLLSKTTGLMKDEKGVMVAKYAARCALRSDQRIQVKQWDNTLVTLPGEVGLAPEWLSGNTTDSSGICAQDCQERVSACLLALTNASGVHVSVALTSALPQIGTATLSTHPYEEGTYFGNVFVSPPKFFVRPGKNYSIGRQLNRSCYIADARAEASSPSVGCMYREAIRPCTLVADTTTARSCVADADGDPTTTGTTTWNNVITVWRDVPSASPAYALFRVADDGSFVLRVR